MLLTNDYQFIRSCNHCNPRCVDFRFPAVHGGNSGGVPDHARYYIPQNYQTADPTRLEQGPPRPIGTKYRGYTGFRNPGAAGGGAEDDDDSIYEYIDTTNDDHMADYGDYDYGFIGIGCELTILGEFD